MGTGAPPAPAQERRAPTIGAALLPTGSGPAPTRLLSYDAEQLRNNVKDEKSFTIPDEMNIIFLLSARIVTYPNDEGPNQVSKVCFEHGSLGGARQT